MKCEKAVSPHSANKRRIRDIVEDAQEKIYESCFFDPDSIDPYEKPIQRPTFGGRLNVSWVRDRL